LTPNAFAREDGLAVFAQLLRMARAKPLKRGVGPFSTGRATFAAFTTERATGFIASAVLVASVRASGAASSPVRWVAVRVMAVRIVGVMRMPVRGV